MTISRQPLSRYSGFPTSQSDSMFSSESHRPHRSESDSSADTAPQFGAIDIVEAFTAMRHEWRGQTKETRALAEQIVAAVENFQSLEPKLLAHLAGARIADGDSDSPAEARPLALLIVETDHQLTRAVAALEQWDSNHRQRSQAEVQAIELYFAGMGRLARWLARPLLNFVIQQRQAVATAGESPATEGLNLVLARLRQAMQEHQIERVDVLGQPFDAATMQALGTVAATDYPSGHVAEQFTAAYRWQGQILRFADVRLAE